ncbi:hypothetical protein N0V93_005417 [Gnomoniopsis smithogilvyi]|uniref:Uncharacterized protein n=1 Tax=Gnomoniopsis smithogilvyi TaxID=1191159 RepID=A0A9W8YWJ7_9PEZI|nr:hypothetical protein N0V93_005417 [Gnomoniopsis smithogilvyi]
MVASRVLGATLIASGLSYAATDSSITSGIKPSLDVAKSRGPQIFNAVHDSMRQWGASLHHNGMSFFLATVPEGVVLHHGNNNEKSPEDPDWLAYEIEHAEHFARGGRGPPGGGKGPGRGGPGGPGGPPALGSMEYGMDQLPLVNDHASMDPDPLSPDENTTEEQKGGWLHTYRTTRPLRYLYVDGMGGGKTTMGTLDSQDYLLRGTKAVFDFDGREEKVHDKRASGGAHQKRTGGPMDEQARAVELCALCKDWNLSGVIRMEAGFEIIQCDFSDGLEEVQALQRPSTGSDQQGPGRGGSGNIEFIRGLSERYYDIGSSRTFIDYSSMVSAYFFPVNLTNPDPKRPDLPRLSSTTDSELAAIQKYLNHTISDRIDNPIRAVDWQDVTDLIVGRYADRIRFMVEKTSTADQIASEISFLMTVYLDYSGKDSDQVSAAIERCTTFYLHGVKPVTEADHLIHAAIRATTSDLCTSLYQVRELVTGDSDLDDSERHSQSVSVLSSLMERLQWARFKSCGGCAVDEVCLIPMWPSGTKQDYDSPRCVNSTSRDDGENYWGGFGPGRGRGGRGGRGPPN